MSGLTTNWRVSALRCVIELGGRLPSSHAMTRPDAQQTGTAGMLAQGWVETNVAEVGNHN
ncbi:hypothetical protein F7C95_18405 [Opitutia bacterium ISCC 51]|nr:hypothetical protein F7C95_18405 [Opitutae bacterium ISCC 51]QXD27936.1 hypothetical protein GA003_18310 [Opitutae bacterium ISCC 52]